MDQKPTALTFNGKTKELTEQELTAEEIANIALTQKTYEAEQSFLAAKTESRKSALAKLAALGLTEKEIGAL
jgi:DNA-binding NarL/FixJ family response regulator